MANRRKIILETPNRRRKKRKRYIRKVIVLSILFILLIAGVVGFFHIPYLKINDVAVTGTSELDPNAIKQTALTLSSGNEWYVFPKTSFFLYPTTAIQQEISKQFKDIDKVEVKRKSINKVEVVVHERSPYAWYCIATCFILDERGYIYKEASTTSSDFVTFRDARPEYASSTPLGNYPLKTEVFKDIETFARNIGPLKLHLKEVVIGVNNDITVITEEGKLIISFRESLPDQLDILKTALAQPLFTNPDGSMKRFGYIDLRFGKKIFYKMNGDPNVAASSTVSTSTASSTQ